MVTAMTNPFQIMKQRFNIDSLSHALTTDNGWVIAAARREIPKTLTRTKASPGSWSLVACVTEFAAGVFAFLYLVAALALGAALLFFTFCH